MFSRYSEHLMHPKSGKSFSKKTVLTATMQAKDVGISTAKIRRACHAMKHLYLYLRSTHGLT